MIMNPFPLNQIFSITIGGTDFFACKLNFISQRTDCVTTFIILYVCYVHYALRNSIDQL